MSMIRKGVFPSALMVVAVESVTMHKKSENMETNYFAGDVEELSLKNAMKPASDPHFTGKEPEKVTDFFGGNEVTDFFEPQQQHQQLQHPQQQYGEDGEPPSICFEFPACLDLEHNSSVAQVKQLKAKLAYEEVKDEMSLIVWIGEKLKATPSDKNLKSLLARFKDDWKKRNSNQEKEQKIDLEVLLRRLRPEDLKVLADHTIVDVLVRKIHKLMAMLSGEKPTKDKIKMRKEILSKNSLEALEKMYKSKLSDVQKEIGDKYEFLGYKKPKMGDDLKHLRLLLKKSRKMAWQKGDVWAVFLFSLGAFCCGLIFMGLHIYTNKGFLWSFGYFGVLALVCFALALPLPCAAEEGETQYDLNGLDRSCNSCGASMHRGAIGCRRFERRWILGC